MLKNLNYKLIYILIFLLPYTLCANEITGPSLFDMPLEDLMQIKVQTTSSLTKTTLDKQPATTTRITQTDIEQSGARSLYELLDIYVPNFYWARHY